MLVSGLQNEALFKMTSGSDADCRDVHRSLRECVEEMLDRYRQKQEQKQEQSQKLGIKTRATEILLCELSKVPEDSGATRETIASALTCHAEALQGYEHLLSKKGNTYALLEQTRHLKERDGGTCASLLQYHDLKDKLLEPDAPLGPDIKEALSVLTTQTKVLTLQTLVALDKQPRTEKTGRHTYIYDDRIFQLKSFLDDRLLEYVECLICKIIINQPREICQQSHVTCPECARQLKEHHTDNCPECRGTLLAEFKQSKPIERLVGKLQVRCCNAGCRSVMEISEIKSHLNLCGEEEIECPGKCIDEGTGKVTRIPRKWLADHGKECLKHFKCDSCIERFPCSTETKYLKRYREHFTEKHTISGNASADFYISLIDKLLSRQEQAQQETILQAEHTGLRIPSTGWNRDGDYHFAGTDCVRTPQDWVYQSKANPRHFFVTLESSLDQPFYHLVVLPFQKYTGRHGETMNLTLRICFSANGKTRFSSGQRLKRWTVSFPLSDSNGSIEYSKNVHVTSYSGSSQEVEGMSSITQGNRIITYPSSYGGNRYLFKIAI